MSLVEEQVQEQLRLVTQSLVRTSLEGSNVWDTVRPHFYAEARTLGMLKSSRDNLTTPRRRGQKLQFIPAKCSVHMNFRR